MNHTAFQWVRWFLLALVVAVGGISEAWAHRVNLFAYVDGGRIVTESWFSKSSRVREGLIEVFDAATGERLLSGTTDDQGNFAFDIPPAARQRKADLRITLKAGEGHGNETMVKAEEYLNSPAAIAPASPAATAAPDAPAASAAGDAVSAASSPAAPVTSGIPDATGTPVPPQAAAPAPVSPDPALLAAMDRMLDAKLAPVKSMLAESLDPAPSMTEILGGVGWIFGLMGVAAYFKSRKG